MTEEERRLEEEEYDRLAEERRENLLEARRDCYACNPDAAHDDGLDIEAIEADRAWRQENDRNTDTY